MQSHQLKIASLPFLCSTSKTFTLDLELNHLVAFCGRGNIYTSCVPKYVFLTSR